MSDEFDVLGFKAVVERHWKYHRPCHHRLWSTEQVEGDVMQFEVAPVFQEVGGGSDDGMRVWSAFSIHLSDLFSEPNLEITEFGCRSYCIECTPIPFFGIRGKYKERPFHLILNLEPIAESKPVEVIDTNNNVVRAIKGE